MYYRIDAELHFTLKTRPKNTVNGEYLKIFIFNFLCEIVADGTVY